METQALPEYRSPARPRRAAVRDGLYRPLRDAARVHGLPDSVVRTAERLIDFIPTDAREPVSPVQVQRLADARGCDPRTVRNHIARLMALGLVGDRRRDGGGRALVRDAAGRIAALFGVSFAPLAAQAERLAALAADIEAALAARARLRAEISSMRHRLRRALAALHATHPLQAAFAALPRRVAHLDDGALGRLWNEIADLQLAVADAARALAQDMETFPSSGEESDRSENSSRPYTTTDPEDSLCSRQATKTPTTLKRAGWQADRPGSQAVATHGLEHVTLTLALAAAPEDWRAEMAAREETGWSGLATLALERCALLGVNRDAWLHAVAVMGRSGAALAVMIADANHVGRGGAIRSPGGWLRGVTQRAEAGEAHLHRSIFGLVARGGGAPMS